MKRCHRTVGGTSLLVTAFLLGVSGCSSAQAESAGEAAQRFLGAVSADQVTDACTMLAPHALESLAGQCEQTLPELDIQLAPVDAVDAWGNDALVRTAAGALFLHESTAGWLVTGAGCHERGELPYECEVGGP